MSVNCAFILNLVKKPQTVMYSGKADMSESVGSRSSESRALRVDLLKEPVLSRLCDALDKSNVKGWRRLGDVVSSDRRFQIR